MSDYLVQQSGDETRSIPSGWTETTLGEVCEKRNQGVNTTTEKVKYVSSGIKVIRAKNIFKGRIDYLDIEYVDKNAFNRLSDHVKPKFGDILYTNIGSQMGLAAKVKIDEEFLIAWNVLRLQPKKTVSTDFLLYFLNCDDTRKQISSRNSSSTMPFINGSDFDSFPIPLPPLPEQQAIASVLSAFDDKIELLREENKTLEMMGQVIFGEMINKTNSVVKLNDLIESANTGLDAIRRAPIVEEETGIKCLRIQDISQNKEFEKWGNTKVSDSDFKKAQLLKDDMIMARTCSPGIIFFVHQNMSAVFNNGLARIRVKNNKCHPILIYNLFKTQDFIGYIAGVSGGTSVQLNIRVSDILNFETKFPSFEEQSEYIAIFENIENKIYSNINQIQSLARSRDDLLPRLMRGEMRVKF